MEKFKEHLKNKGYVKKTINRTYNQTKAYQKWLELKNIKSEELTYQDILNYIGDLQSEKTSILVINDILRSICNYQSYKKYPNPTIEVRVLGRIKKYHILLTNKEIEKILKSYKKSILYNETEYILLQLIINQALERHEILKLKKREINLEEGIIYISQSQKKNERILKLESDQILQLQKYINKLPEERENFIVYNQLRNKLKSLLKSLQNQKSHHGIEIKSHNQLRQSRYKEWIKQHGLRKAQYLGGFKKVSSIQVYKDKDLENLKENIKKYHPLQ
jgi:site-specific recombinase XerD